MGYPFREGLNELITELLTPEEDQEILTFPKDIIPLQLASADHILDKTNHSKEKLTEILEGLDPRGLVNSARKEKGEIGRQK